jgi:CBS domain-containing protein
MSFAGLPRDGLLTIGQIVGTNRVRFHVKQNGMSVALELLAIHSLGGPVVDDAGKFVGFISEFDVLRIIESGGDLAHTTADQIMNTAHIVVRDSTSITDAIKIMTENHSLMLPVEKDGKVSQSVTRHDLLRARIGLGLEFES